MRKYLFGAAVCALTLAPGFSREKAGHADEKDHVVVQPDKIKWGPAPPALPAGAQMAVLVGDPGKKGVPFVIRAKLPTGYKVAPHFHPGDENVTVLHGTFMIGRGEKFDKDKMEEMPAGAFMRMPMGMRHFAMAKSEVIIQVHGIGPFEITYVNSSDDPRNKEK
jgi:hypothetical protein